MRRTTRTVAATAGLSLAIAALGGRKRRLRWGATNEEVRGTLPGDDLIPVANLSATRAISVRRRRDVVWPWIAQLGQGRGGFYSYDFLENLVGCNIKSAEQIAPEWQHVVVGDEVRLAPDVPLKVALVEPGRTLVLRGGAPIGDTPPPYDFTWAFTLATHRTARHAYSSASATATSAGGHDRWSKWLS